MAKKLTQYPDLYALPNEYSDPIYDKMYTKFHTMVFNYHKRFGLWMPKSMKLEIWQKIVDAHRAQEHS